ncbi:hypothetical protein Rsub_00880 [Raphidocelis subcapitata]|uniref:Uncharacterized protein n=1 Tax=Raphidocelis subcapitata TaxID=307507 RepID=A0A2V0NL96_9CHLO|nr:hypothetical protein Rsub_00880 [Raphidocelis subcapitata]|eukprot:GBF88168.1 hypothetical protein Rsub_00880 [Raphidocelis subcapitata]
MAGRGRHATLPAWMTAAGGAPAAGSPAPGAAVSPGAAAAPALAPRPGPAAPGSGGFAEPGRAPIGAAHMGMPGGAPAAVAAFGASPAAAARPQQQQQQPAGPVPVAGGAPSSEGWTEHKAPDGRPYYYNSITKVSAWTKPEPLMTPEERARAAAAAAAAKLSAQQPAGGAPMQAQRQPQPQQQQQQQQQPAAAPAAAPTAAAGGAPDPEAVAAAWREHSAPDGRKYYHNRLTKESRWVMPEEMKAARAAAEAQRVHPGGPAAAAAQQQARQPEQQQQQQQAPQQAVVYASKEDAVEAFKELLAAAGVGGDDSWDSALRRLIHDARYNAIPSIGERKAVFNEWVTARRNEERDQARRRTAEAKEAFAQMLDECSGLRPGDTYRMARSLLQDDPRWGAVPNESAREELFDSFMRGFRQRVEERERRERKEREAAYRELLRESGFKASTQWRRAAARLEGAPAFAALERVDRLRVFQEHVQSLEEEERRERDRAREEERRTERRRRDAFKALLREHMGEGRIGPKTRWRDYGPTVEGEPAYAALTKNRGGSRPKELFTDLVEELEGEYDAARSAFKDAAKEAGWEPAADSSWEEFLERLAEGGAALEAAGGPGLKGIRDSFRRVYFEEAAGAARLKAEESDRRARRARDAFASFLRHARGLGAGTAWGEFEGAFQGEPEFAAVGAEAARELFDEHVEKLKRRSRPDDDDSGGHRHKKKRSSKHDEERPKSKRSRHGRSRSRSADRSRDRRRHREDSSEEGEAPADGRARARGGSSDEAEEGEV